MKDIITEQFVDELVHSDMWAKVDKADPISENRTAAYTRAPAEAPTESEEEDAPLSEELTAEEWAVELLENLAPEVVLEFIDILHEELLNEQAEAAEGDDERVDELLGLIARGLGRASNIKRNLGTQFRGAQQRGRDTAASKETVRNIRHRTGTHRTSGIRRYTGINWLRRAKDALTGAGTDKRVEKAVVRGAAARAQSKVSRGRERERFAKKTAGMRRRRFFGLRPGTKALPKTGKRSEIGVAKGEEEAVEKAVQQGRGKEDKPGSGLRPADV